MWKIVLICMLLMPSLVMATTTTIELHDLTNLTESDDLLKVMKWVDEPTDGMMWISTILVVWLIIFGTLVFRFPLIDALMSSLVVTTVFSVILATLGLVNANTVALPMILLVLLIIIKVASPPT